MGILSGDFVQGGFVRGDFVLEPNTSWLSSSHFNGENLNVIF